MLVAQLDLVRGDDLSVLGGWRIQQVGVGGGALWMNHTTVGGLTRSMMSRRDGHVLIKVGCVVVVREATIHSLGGCGAALHAVVDLIDAHDALCCLWGA